MRRILRNRDQRRGSAAIEFVGYLFITLWFLSGIVDFGWYMSRAEVVMRAARDGARHGAYTQEQGQIIAQANARAQATLATLQYSGCSTTTQRFIDTDGLDYLRTVVQCPYTPLVGMMPGLPTQISYSFTMYSE